MFISDILYILKYFNLYFIPFFIVNTVVFYTLCPTSPSRILRKNKLARKEMIDKLYWNMYCF